MATINDYLDHNKNRSFEDFAFNEADILCLNELGYFCFEELDASIDFSKEVNLHEVLMPYVTGEKLFNHSFLVTEERVKLLQKVVASKRFVNLNLSDYVNDVDAEYERQFSAMVFTLPEINHHQLVFRGTDDTMIGWKEDFMGETRTLDMHIASLRDKIKKAGGADCIVTVRGVGYRYENK